MVRVAAASVVLVLALAGASEAQQSDSARNAPLPLGTVLRVTLPAQSGPVIAIGAVTALRDERDCLHITTSPESETPVFGVRVADQVTIERQLGTPRADGSVPAEPRWVAVPRSALDAAKITCIMGD